MDKMGASRSAGHGTSSGIGCRGGPVHTGCRAAYRSQWGTGMTSVHRFRSAFAGCGLPRGESGYVIPRRDFKRPQSGLPQIAYAELRETLIATNVHGGKFSCAHAMAEPEGQYFA